MTDRDRLRLTGIHPELVQKITDIFDEMERDGFHLFIVQGLRTQIEQAAIYAQGRTKPGKVVTNKDGVKFRSDHQADGDGWGHAVDIAFIPDKKITDPFSEDWPWEKLGENGEAKGLTWGGRWSHPHDLDHFQLPASQLQTLTS